MPLLALPLAGSSKTPVESESGPAGGRRCCRCCRGRRPFHLSPGDKVRDQLVGTLRIAGLSPYLQEMQTWVDIAAILKLLPWPLLSSVAICATIRPIENPTVSILPCRMQIQRPGFHDVKQIPFAFQWFPCRWNQDKSHKTARRHGSTCGDRTASGNRD